MENLPIDQRPSYAQYPWYRLNRAWKSIPTSLRSAIRGGPAGYIQSKVFNFIRNKSGYKSYPARDLALYMARKYRRAMGPIATRKRKYPINFYPPAKKQKVAPKPTAGVVSTQQDVKTFRSKKRLNKRQRK